MLSKVPKRALEPASRLRIPVRVKIAFPFALLALIFAIVAAYVVSQVVIDSESERFANHLIESGKAAEDWMVQEENRLLTTWRALAYMEGLPETAAARNAERLRELALPVAINQRAEAIEILDEEGASLLSLHHVAEGNVEDYAATTGEDLFVGRDLVRKVLEQDYSKGLDKHASVEHTPWGDYLYVVGPISAGNGDPIAVLLVGRSLPTLVRQNRADTLAQVTIYDKSGQPLASTLPGEAGPLAAEAVNSIAPMDASWLRSFSVASTTYSEIVGPFETRDGSRLGFLGAALPESFLVNASLITRLQILALVAIGILLVISTGVYVADRITNPLLRVVRASNQVAQGDLEVSVEPMGNDEVADLARSFNHMVAGLREGSIALALAYDATLEGWSRALDLRDQETEGHTLRVTELTLRLVQAMGIPNADLVHIRRGALLHDIGKMGIPDKVLLKPGALTPEEWKIMRQHPVYAYDLLLPIVHLRAALDIPYCHHEKWDGTGYPRGLKGEDIPLAARLFAIVDVWDALTSNRPYRSAWTREKALEYIREQAGKHFDPRVVEAFLDLQDSLESTPEGRPLAPSAA